VKTRSDGVPLVGLAMNRTQCRSTSDDFLVDPVLLRRSAAGEPVSGFLVGAYCVEDELILLRRLHFPRGVAPGDVIALVNTGGYLMHILESASHQIPLARNLVRGPEGFALDRIDLAPPG
jgi:diaminopimelate decarboxylase